VYALGITLFHLLVGQPPYAGKSIKEIHASHLAGLPLQPERRVPRLPKPLGDLVRDMTRRDVLDRPFVAQVVERIDGIGGEEIRTKQGVRLRRRSRRGAFAGSGRGRSPAWPAAVGALAVGGVALALLLRDSGDGSGGGTPQPGTGRPVARREPERPPTPPAPPPVDPEVARRAAEERAKAEAKATAEAEARRALEGVAAFARESWQDKAGVVRRYRGVVSRYPGTPAADEAKRRADGIARGIVHSHPDRQMVPKEVVEAAGKAWEAARPEYEDAIARRRYDLAIALPPVGVEDAEGPVAEDILFHRALARDLGDFLATLRRSVPQMPEPARRVSIEGQEHRVQSVAETGLVLRGPDGQTTVAWADLPPAAMYDLATAAFREKGTREATLLVAVAFAHRLSDRFWTAVLQARGGTPTKEESAALDEYEKRAAERLGS
jgi:hypothetical protein